MEASSLISNDSLKVPDAATVLRLLTEFPFHVPWNGTKNLTEGVRETVAGRHTSFPGEPQVFKREF
jgi:hypothetical protein